MFSINHIQEAIDLISSKNYKFEDLKILFQPLADSEDKTILLQLLNEVDFRNFLDNFYHSNAAANLSDFFFPLFGFIEEHFDDGEQVSFPDRVTGCCSVKATDTVIHWNKDKRILFEFYYCDKCDISDGEGMASNSSILSLYHYFVLKTDSCLSFKDNPIMKANEYDNYLSKRNKD